GNFYAAIYAASGSVVNTTGGQITGTGVGMYGGPGLIIANQGSISGAITSGLSLDGHSVVINAAGGSIGGAVYGIFGAEEE
ncbi:hypothetical protein ABTN52_19390, partial [Acinetobacter baumannii]